MADLTYNFLESVLNVVVAFMLQGKYSVTEQNKFLVDEMSLSTDLINEGMVSELLTDVRRWATLMGDHPERLLPIRLRLNEETKILTVSTGYRNAVRKQIRFDEGVLHCMNIGRALKLAASLPPYDYSLEPDKQRQRRMAIFEAVVSPIPQTGQKLSVDLAKEEGCEIVWNSYEEYVELQPWSFEGSSYDVMSKQPYVYRNMLEWYIAHPEFLEVPFPHNKGNGVEVAELATILFCDGVKRVGNGNHRIAAAMLLGKKRLKVRHLEVKEILPRADIQTEGVVQAISAAHGRREDLCDSEQQSTSSQVVKAPNAAENLIALVKTICQDVRV